MIVITTPTGRVGSRLVELLLEQGKTLRLIARDASSIDQTVRERVEIVEGSHADAGVLDRALAGADALFWLVPPNPAAPSAEEHYLEFARVASAAIARNEVGHVVGVTSAGHGWETPAGLLSAAFAMDAELEKSGAHYRAVSLPFYMENLVGQLDAMRTRGAFSLSCAADRSLATIATRDIAGVAAELLADLSWSGQENLPVFGPDRLTPDDMAQVISEELGITAAYRPITLEDFGAMLRSRGASEQAVSDTVDMFAAQDAGMYNSDWAVAKIAPTDFRTWCREVLKPAANPLR